MTTPTPTVRRFVIIATGVTVEHAALADAVRSAFVAAWVDPAARVTVAAPATAGATATLHLAVSPAVDADGAAAPTAAAEFYQSTAPKALEVSGAAACTVREFVGARHHLAAASWQRAVWQAQPTLVVGAGGIGCELLKDLALGGCLPADTPRALTVLDLDTIDGTNLNRQFLFRPSDVGAPKAEIASRRVNAWLAAGAGSVKDVNDEAPAAVVAEGHLADVKDTTRFPVEFYARFGCVINGLDNVGARKHVNRMCMEARVPLVESGTMGYNGQAQPILRGTTECYDCAPKAAGQRTFAVCTIHARPTTLVHCTHYAKELYGRFFGDARGAVVSALDEQADGNVPKAASAVEPATTAAPATASEFAALEAEVVSRWRAGLTPCKIPQAVAQPLSPLAVKCSAAHQLWAVLDAAAHVAEVLFDLKVRDLLDLRKDAAWATQPPAPLPVGALLHQAIVANSGVAASQAADAVGLLASRVYDRLVSAPLARHTPPRAPDAATTSVGPAPLSRGADFAQIEALAVRDRVGCVVAPATLSDSKFAVPAEHDKAPQVGALVVAFVDAFTRCCIRAGLIQNPDAEGTTFSTSAPRRAARVVAFEKNDEDTMAFVAAVTNLRAAVFHIPRDSAFEVRTIAGSIVPAIASTNAAIAAAAVRVAAQTIGLRAALGGGSGPHVPAGVVRDLLLRDLGASTENTAAAPNYVSMRLHPQRRRAPKGAGERRFEYQVVTAFATRPPNASCLVCREATGGAARLTVRVHPARLGEVTLGALVDEFLMGEMGLGAPSIFAGDRTLYEHEEAEALRGAPLGRWVAPGGQPCQWQVDDLDRPVDWTLIVTADSHVAEDTTFAFERSAIDSAVAAAAAISVASEAPVNTDAAAATTVVDDDDDVVAYHPAKRHAPSAVAVAHDAAAAGLDGSAPQPAALQDGGVRRPRDAAEEIID